MKGYKKRLYSRCIAAILTAVMVVGIILADLTAVYAEETSGQVVLPKKPQKESASSMEAGEKVTWDCVWFGNYPQSEVTDADNVYAELQSASGWVNNEITIDGITYRRMKKGDATFAVDDEDEYYKWTDEASYHYFRYEKVKWRVLDVSGQKALLMADVALDGQRYNEEDTDVTWETSTLRAWLNGGTQRGSFRDSAFSAKEQAAICDTRLTNEDNSYYDTPGGNATTDKIYLLSETDVYAGSNAASYGFSQDQEVIDEARRAKSSVYAKAMGVYSEVEEADYEGNCMWWLRTPGVLSSYVGNIDYDGYTDMDGIDVDSGHIAVRPVLWLDLSSDVWSRAGTVCSDGTVLEESEKIFVQQHVDYINSADYKSDIAKGFSGMLADTLESVKKDNFVKTYNVASTINDALQYELDLTEQYELVLAQLMINDQSYSGIQEAYMNNVWKESYKMIDLLLTSCDGTAQLVNADAVSTLKYLYKQVGKTNFSAEDYAKFYEKTGRLIDRKINVFEARKVFEKIDLGYDIADAAVTTASELAEYIAWGNAYIDTVDEFKDVLGMMYIHADYCFWYESDGTLAHFFDTSSLKEAILKFVDGMEAYKENGAKAIAEKGVGLLAKNGGAKIASKVTDVIFSKVPILNIVPILKGALETGLNVVDIFTSVDDRAYNGDMLVKMYYLDIIMTDAVKGNIADGFEQMLLRKKTFENTKKFDEAVNVYKTAHMLSCEFAAGYLDAVSRDAILSRTKLKNATYISALYAQRLQYGDIQCHDEGVVCQIGEEVLVYSGDPPLRVLTVACPVTVNIKDEKGQDFASISSEKVTVRKGYSRYCFTMGRENEIKVAIIPENYSVDIVGTGSGSMDIWTGACSSKDVVQVVGVKAVPVTGSSRAKLSFVTGGATLVSDGKSYEVKPEQTETPVTPQKPNPGSNVTTPQKKTIDKLKVTAKKGKNKIVIQTIAGAKVKVSMQKKYIKDGKKKSKAITISAKKNKKGKITVKLAKKLKKKMKIKVTVSKSGYKTKTKSVKVS